MKKLLSIVLVAVFALSFAAAFVPTRAEAHTYECPTYCEDGILYACEAIPIGHGQNYKCICRAVGYCW
ncbi:MAG: hypothetical protein JSV52_12310 [Candidatus Zixiibacteriota bacterium]|nr:MAG: hypothetical protein JSV52_12310 [candidate division Zixibacteria bacterium]